MARRDARESVKEVYRKGSERMYGAYHTAGARTTGRVTNEELGNSLNESFMRQTMTKQVEEANGRHSFRKEKKRI